MHTVIDYLNHTPLYLSKTITQYNCFKTSLYYRFNRANNLHMNSTNIITTAQDYKEFIGFVNHLNIDISCFSLKLVYLILDIEMETQNDIFFFASCVIER